MKLPVEAMNQNKVTSGTRRFSGKESRLLSHMRHYKLVRCLFFDPRTIPRETPTLCNWPFLNLYIINLHSFAATPGAAPSSHGHPELRHAQRRKTLMLTFVRRRVSIKFKANLTLTLDESVKRRANQERFHSRAARCVIMSEASTVLMFTVSNTPTSLGSQVICWFGNNRKWKSQVSVLFLASSSLL